MAHWALPAAPRQLLDTTHATAATTFTTTITASGTAHTKGSYTTLVASTADETDLIFLNTAGTAANGVNSSSLMDIAVGAAASEVDVISNLAVGYSQGRALTLPFKVPAGTRISARMQSAVTSQTCTVEMSTAGGYAMTGRDLPTAVDTIGANTGTSAGVSVPSGAANTKSSWVEITPSTAADYIGFAFGVQGNSQTVMTTKNHLFDLGVGASGSEVVIMSNLAVTSNSIEATGTVFPDTYMLRATVPAGSRLAIRRQTTSATESQMDFILYGFRR